MPTVVLHNVDGHIEKPVDTMALLMHFPTVLLGFSGTVTHHKCSRELLNILWDCPLEKMLLSTGSPDFAPSGCETRLHPCVVRVRDRARAGCETKLCPCVVRVRVRVGF